MTSGPQDPHQDGSDQQPPYGQQPGYEQPGYEQTPQGQGGYAAYPASYPAAPPGSPGGELGAPTERPTTVKAGIGTFLANVLIGLLSSLLIFTGFDSQIDELAETQGLTSDEASTALMIGAVLGLLITAAFLAVLWFAWQGRNWARIVLFVLGGLTVLSSVFGPALGLLGIIQLLLVIAGIVLLALKPSSDWYRAETQRRQRF